MRKRIAGGNANRRQKTGYAGPSLNCANTGSKRYERRSSKREIFNYTPDCTVSSKHFQKLSGKRLNDALPYPLHRSISGCALGSGFALNSRAFCALGWGFRLQFSPTQHIHRSPLISVILNRLNSYPIAFFLSTCLSTFQIIEIHRGLWPKVLRLTSSNGSYISDNE